MTDRGLLSADRRVVHDLHIRLLGLLAEAEQAYGPLGLRLEGGTALAAYYLGHRQSEDLDVFGDPAMDARDFGHFVARLAADRGLRTERTGPSNRGFAEHIVFDPAAASGPVRVQLLRASPFALDAVRQTREGLPVGSFRDIAAGKAHAICDRYEPRDFVDLHAILHRPTPGGKEPTAPEIRARIRTLAADLTAVDPGLTPARFGVEVARADGREVVREFPLRLLHPVTDGEIAATVAHVLDELAAMARETIRGHEG